MEFPESRIHEEMLFLLSISDRELTDAEIIDTAMQRGTGAGGSGSAGVLGPPAASSQIPPIAPAAPTETAGADEDASSFRPVVEDNIFASRLSSNANATPSVAAGSASAASTASRSSFASSYRLGRR